MGTTSTFKIAVSSHCVRLNINAGCDEMDGSGLLLGAGMLYTNNTHHHDPCPGSAPHSVLLWPPAAPDTEAAAPLLVNVTILLPRTYYMSHLKRTQPEAEVSLLAAMKRAGPAILAGLEEGVTRGGRVDGRRVAFR